jgi:hypothetical protein
MAFSGCCVAKRMGWLGWGSCETRWDPGQVETISWPSGSDKKLSDCGFVLKAGSTVGVGGLEVGVFHTEHLQNNILAI